MNETKRVDRTFPVRPARIAAVGAVLAALAPAPALADAVVLQSSAPDLSAGAVVPEGGEIEVPDGARAVFLTRDGFQIAVDGPYSGAVPGGDGALPDGWEALLGSSEVDMRDVGATRALEIEQADPATAAGSDAPAE
jgi:hypothetical protein